MLSKIKNEYLAFFISFLIYFPIILCGGYFLDDNYRSVYAYYDWTGDYRPVADIIYNLLGLNSNFIDTFPLNYIIQFFLIAYFIIYFTKKIQTDFLIEEKFKNYISISISFLFLSPMFTQNLYFRYDSLIMVLSVIIACLPFFFNNKKIDLVCCVLILFTYQSSIIGYMCIVVLRMLKLNITNTNRVIIYKELIKSITVLISGLIIFFAITKFFITPNHYAEKHFSLVNSFEFLIQNIEYSLSNLFFSNSIFDYTISLSTLLICISVILTIIFKNQNINIFDKFLFFLGIILVLLICLFNINSLLQTPRLYPRTYIGIGFILFFSYFSLILLLSKKIINKNQYFYYLFVNFLMFYTAIMFLNIQYAGFNYIKENKRYENMLINRIIYDLSTLDIKSFNYAMAYGTIKSTKRATAIETRYPILKNTLDNNFNFKNNRIFYTLLQNEGFEFKKIGRQKIKNISLYNSYINNKPTIERTEYNILVTTNNDLFIYFKENGFPVKVPIIENRLD